MVLCSSIILQVISTQTITQTDKGNENRWWVNSRRFRSTEAMPPAIWSSPGIGSDNLIATYTCYCPYHLLQWLDHMNNNTLNSTILCINIRVLQILRMQPHTPSFCIKENRFNVDSLSTSATTMSPSEAVFCFRITIISPLLIPAPIIESPLARKIKNSPSPNNETGRETYSSIYSSSSCGIPQDTDPSTAAGFVSRDILFVLSVTISPLR